MYDCTLYPPRDLTQELMTEKCRRKTLQTMGWFPSAKICLLYADDEEGKKNIFISRSAQQEHYERNTPNCNNDQNCNTIEFSHNYMPQKTTIGSSNNSNSKPSSTFLPSQVIQAVTQYREEEI
jgi:hypothetical protein